VDSSKASDSSAAGGADVAGDEALVRRFYEEVINQRELDETLASADRASKYFTDEFVHNVLSEGLADYWPDAAHVESMLDGAFPDTRYTVEDLITAPDRVVTRWAARGTHRTTGRWVRWEGVTIFQMAGGKIARVWSFSDEVDLLRQLGVSIRFQDALAAQ
jgi:predicted ester cyclase